MKTESNILRKGRSCACLFALAASTGLGVLILLGFSGSRRIVQLDSKMANSILESKHKAGKASQIDYVNAKLALYNPKIVDYG
ncbi:MAG: hypothetical protein ABUL72_00780 [Armatimonadota bacterium]